MPHRCIGCNTLYDDNAPEILTGCPCGRKLFLYIRDADKANSKKFIRKLDDKKINYLEKQAHELIPSDDEDERPIVINFESIKGSEAGKVNLDLDKISKDKPIVFELEEGKYIIDLANFSGTEKKATKGKKSKILKSKKGLLHGESE